VAGPAAGAGVALAGAYKKELLALLQTKGPQVLIGLLKSKGKLDVVGILSANLLGKHALPFYAAPKVAEGYTDDIETTKQFRNAIAGLKARSAIDKAKDGAGAKYYSDGAKVTPQETARRAAERKSEKDKKGVAEEEQQTQAKTWDQMSAQEKSSGVKGRTVWNEKTQRYYTVFDVPVSEVDEASLATMRDYFAGDENARDPYDITKQRLHFSKDKNARPTVDKRFRSPAEYQAWLKQNKLQQISGANESTNDKGWSLINKSKS
jgi:hypothetical protein